MLVITFSILLFFLNLIDGAPHLAENKIHPDTGLRIDGLLEKYGYPLETHNVTTEDGYIITMHRIPHGINNNNNNGTKPAVLLMHGLLSSSADWVNMGPKKALALLLADIGYDVWLGNQRGNTWGKHHINQTLTLEQFYNFSFNEIGYYDIAAKIDYILSHTKQDKLTYVGHSQGTTVMFALLTQRPEYNDKIKLFSALAPVAYISHAKCPLTRWMADNYDAFTEFLENFQIFNVFDFNSVYTIFGETICNDPKLQGICSAILFEIAGHDPDELDMNFISVITSNAPSGASTKQIIHYIQEIRSGKFQQYDYGTEGNLAQYGQETPIEYDLSKVTAPVILHYSQNDYFADIRDVDQLLEELPNGMKKMVSFEKFNHLDFLWAKDVKEFVYDEVINEINSYN